MICIDGMIANYFDDICCFSQMFLKTTHLSCLLMALHATWYLPCHLLFQLRLSTTMIFLILLL